MTYQTKRGEGMDNWQARPWQARTAAMFTDAQLRRLHEAHVMIFGLGGVGSYLTEALGRSGVGKLTLVDADVVSETNLNRQLPALRSTLGQSKAQLIRQRLLDVNPEAEITAVEAFYLPTQPVVIPEDVCFVADAIDTISAKIDLAVVCRARGIPLLSCMGMGNRYDPTQIRIGDLFQTTGCPLCRVMRRELRKRGVDKLACVYSQEPAHACERCAETKASGHPSPGSLPYVPSVAGLLMAYEIVRQLTI